MENRPLPRRIYLDQHTPAELAIQHAMVAVEAAGADPLLTDAVILLGQAKAKVSDFVDRPLPANPALARLVIAARKVAFEDQGPESLRELDQASEAFAEVVPWDDAPHAAL